MATIEAALRASADARCAALSRIAGAVAASTVVRARHRVGATLSAELETGIAGRLALSQTAHAPGRANVAATSAVGWVFLQVGTLIDARFQAAQADAGTVHTILSQAAGISAGAAMVKAGADVCALATVALPGGTITPSRAVQPLPSASAEETSSGDRKTL